MSDQLNSKAGLAWIEDISVCVGIYRYLPLYTRYISVSISVSRWDAVKTINMFSSTGKIFLVIRRNYTN